jgi:hypothetical protein
MLAKYGTISILVSRAVRIDDHKTRFLALALSVLAIAFEHTQARRYAALVIHVRLWVTDA